MKEAAAAVRNLVMKMIETHVAKNFLGVVTDTTPVVVKIVGTDLDLSETDATLLLSHLVRKYDFEHGLAIGDTLLLVAAHGGQYVATAVVTENTSFGGIRANKNGAPALVEGGALVGTFTGGHVTVAGTDYPVTGGTVSVPLVGKTPYNDAEGNPLGQVPVV